MNSQQQKNKTTKTDFFLWGFSRILLTTQQCMQNICKNLEKLIQKFSAAAFLIRNMFTKTFVFSIYAKEVKSLNWIYLRKKGKKLS